MISSSHQHEELVLLLIQLRRDQANLQCWLEMLDEELSLLRDPDSLQGSPTRMKNRLVVFRNACVLTAQCPWNYLCNNGSSWCRQI